MRNLVKTVNDITEASEKEYIDALVNNKPKGKPVQPNKNNIHVHGVGRMTKELADKYYPDVAQTEYQTESVEISEAKWVTPPTEPATNLKRGDLVVVQHPTENHKMLSGTYLQSQTGNGKPGHPTGHMIKLHKPIDGSGTPLHWAKPEHVFRNIGDGWKGPQKVSEDIEDEINEGSLSKYSIAYLKGMKKQLSGIKGKHLIKHKYNLSKELHSRGVTEANEGVDNISMTVPLFIRCLEWAHEDCKDDVELHQFVEKIIAKGGVLSTDDYEDLMK